MADILLFDDVDVAVLPSGYDAYGGYDDGIYRNISQIRARFPNAHILSISISANDVGDALDVESGDATIYQAAAWFRKALSSGVTRPCFYTEVSNADSLVQTLAEAGIPRSAYRLWTAHYDMKHICGPATCNQTSHAADATQWTKTAFGRNLDESECLGDFFTLVTPPAPGGHPTLIKGDTGAEVKLLQERLDVWHMKPSVTEDGVFGPATLTCVEDFQRARKLTIDGIVGPQTWSALLRNPPVIPFPVPGGAHANADVVILTWDAVPDTNGHAPTGYKVAVLDAGHIVDTLTTASLNATIKGLTRNKVYEFEISAEGGEGTPGVAKVSVTA